MPVGWLETEKNFRYIIICIFICPGIPLTDKQRENLKIFEKECLNEHLRLKKLAASNDMNHKIMQMQEKYAKFLDQ